MRHDITKEVIEVLNNKLDNLDNRLEKSKSYLLRKDLLFIKDMLDLVASKDLLNDESLLQLESIIEKIESE